MLEPLGGAAVPNPERRLSKPAAVAALGQAALTGLDVTELLDRACVVLCEALHVEYAKVLHQPRPGAPLVMVAGKGWHDDVVVAETTVPCGPESQAGYTLISNGTVIVDDLRTEQRFRGPALLDDHDVVSGMSVLIPDESRPYGVLGVHTAEHREFTLDEGDFLRLVANVIGGAVQNDRARTQVRMHAAAQERRVLFEAALAKCAHALLASSGDRRLEQALEALLSATNATSVFVERNVDVDPSGLCSLPVARVVQPTNALEYAARDDLGAIPWTEMHECRIALESGSPHRIPADDPGAGIDDPLRSELRIPIFTDGEWAGLVGFSDKGVVRDWTAEDIALLETAGRMIGAFWEREDAEAKLQAVIRSKDELVAAVSHELRTPLTVVLGLAAELVDGRVPLEVGEQEELMRSIVAQSRDMAFLIEDLLVSARVDTGSVRVHLGAVDLRIECEELVRLMSTSEAFECRVEGDAVAWADATRTRQIIRNLLTNAHRHGGTTVVADLSMDGAHAVMTIRDDGPGIPDEDRARVFEAYERGYDRPGVSQSIGLGLTVSHRLARLMGGDLSYDHVDGWSCFILTVPAARG